MENTGGSEKVIEMKCMHASTQMSHINPSTSVEERGEMKIERFGRVIARILRHTPHLPSQSSAQLLPSPTLPAGFTSNHQFPPPAPLILLPNKIKYNKKK